MPTEYINATHTRTVWRYFVFVKEVPSLQHLGAAREFVRLEGRQVEMEFTSVVQDAEETEHFNSPRLNGNCQT